MRLSEGRIRRIIREEARRVLREGDDFFRADPDEIADAATRIISFHRSDYEKEDLLDNLDELEDVLPEDGWLDTGTLTGYARDAAEMIADVVTGSSLGVAVDDARACIAAIREELVGGAGDGGSGGGFGSGPTPEKVITRFKDEGRRAWDRVSNDFHEMAGGSDGYGARGQYPGWSDDDFRRVARELDAHFGL